MAFGKPSSASAPSAIVNRASSSAKKVLPLHGSWRKEIDYKDIDTLKDFIQENGKIMPGRVTAPRPATSASSPPQSSAPASWRCCRIAICTSNRRKEPHHANHPS